LWRCGYSKPGLAKNTISTFITSLVLPFDCTVKGDALVKEVRSTTCIYPDAGNGTISPPFCSEVGGTRALCEFKFLVHNFGEVDGVEDILTVSDTSSFRFVVCC
jgi:hypothetical protein